MPAADPSLPPSQLTTMMTGDTPPLDLVTIRATCHRALAHRPVALPRAEEIHELTTTLRGDIEDMLPEACFRVDQLPCDLRWDSLQNMIRCARAELADSPGVGLYSAFVHMQALGRAAQFLVEYLQE
ncbi:MULTISPECIES: DUF6415 family natural product biosynthesis protein [Streptomyces]|uniref:DUF6415 family natural product biosynthesis protein n=1 Tax=Streptomyces TaxID=1883 RepID=UPI00345C1C8E